MWRVWNLGQARLRARAGVGPAAGLGLVALLAVGGLSGQVLPAAVLPAAVPSPVSGAGTGTGGMVVGMAGAAAGGMAGGLAGDDLSAWWLEGNDTLIIPDRLLAHPRPTPARWRGTGGGARTAANINRNPLNIKFGSETRWHVEMGVATISDVVPLDGGRFLKFDSSESGFRAAIALLANPVYSELGLDRALRKWSNDGYGAEIVAATLLSARKVVGDLTDRDLEVLLTAMAIAEGYRSATLGTEVQKAIGG